MKPRHGYRLSAKQRANAERCGVPLPDWLAMTWQQRRALRAAKTKEADRG